MRQGHADTSTEWQPESEAPDDGEAAVDFVRGLLQYVVEDAVDDVARDIELDCDEVDSASEPAESEYEEETQEYENRMEQDGLRNDASVAFAVASPKKEAVRVAPAPLTLKTLLVKVLIDGAKNGSLVDTLKKVCPQSAREEAESDEEGECAEQEGEGATGNWSLNAAAHLTEMAVDAATISLHSLSLSPSSTCGSNAGSLGDSLWVEVGGSVREVDADDISVVAEGDIPEPSQDEEYEQDDLGFKAAAQALSPHVCPRRLFGRLLRPKLNAPKSYVAAKGIARGLLSHPVLFAPPPMQDVDWSVVGAAAGLKTKAPPTAARTVTVAELPTAASPAESGEQMLEALLESVTVKLRPVSTRIATPRFGTHEMDADLSDGGEADGDSIESLLASLSDVSVPTPAPRKQVPANAVAPSPLTKLRSLKESPAKHIDIGGSPLSDVKPVNSGRPGSSARPAASFRMDAADSRAASPNASARESSLARGFEAMGRTEIHNMDALDSFAMSPTSSAKLAPLKPPGQRPMSRSRVKPPLGSASTPLRAAGFSALALDLGLDAGSPTQYSGFAAEQRAPPSPAGSPNGPRSASLGTLRVTKAAHMNMETNDASYRLPGQLTGYSAGSIAWSTARSRRQANFAGF